MNTKKAFSKKQKIIISIWLLIAVLLGWHAILNQYGSVDKIVTNFTNFNLILLGFVLTFFTITSSLLGNELTKRLQDTNAYYSLMTNFYWLIVLLFFNLVASFIFQFFGYLELSYRRTYTDLIIIFDVALLFLLLWYAISRLSRFIKNIK